MPIFNYKCNDCSADFERMVGVTAEEEELKCPECGSKKIEKQLSGFSVGSSGASSAPPSCSTGMCGLG